MKIFERFSLGDLVFWFFFFSRYFSAFLDLTREEWKRQEKDNCALEMWFCFIPTTTVQGVYVSYPHRTVEDTVEDTGARSPSWV